MDINYLDLSFLGILILCAIIGGFRGLTKEFTGVLALILGVISARNFSENISVLLENHIPSFFLNVVSFIVTVVLSYFLLCVIAYFIHRKINFPKNKNAKNKSIGFSVEENNNKASSINLDAIAANISKQSSEEFTTARKLNCILGTIIGSLKGFLLCLALSFPISIFSISDYVKNSHIIPYLQDTTTTFVKIALNKPTQAIQEKELDILKK